MKTEQEIRDRIEGCLRAYKRETISEHRAKINLERAMILQWALEISIEEMDAIFSKIQKEEEEGRCS